MKNKKIQDFVFFSIVILISFLFPKFEKYVPSKEVLSELENQIISPTISPIGQILQTQNGQVVKVVDGDTVDVLINNKKERIRIIGINSPESVDPRKPVECFGKEASDFAKSLLTGKIVFLEPDESQDNIDRYGRLLRYVYLPNKTDFGFLMIKNGYAYEYTYDLPYKKQKEYRQAQKEAENKKVGLWGENACK